MRAVILDTEAVAVLVDPGHSKHRMMVAHLEGLASRARRGVAVVAVVPTAARVEAGWDRRTPSAAAINRFRVHDSPLRSSEADVAAAVHARTGKGVADSHIGAVVQGVAAHDDVVVLTSDPDDMTLVASPRRITAVRI
ncbi:MAG: hypothetical protein M3P83_07930 [Actinomycetota bacterium]|nr:hypothetical protein [Actinomycetota bacterium]